MRNLVERATGRRPTGPICLLTHLRYLGYVFNPVSFYYVWDAKVGEEAVCVGVCGGGVGGWVWVCAFAGGLS